VAIVSQWQSASDEARALALACEAVIRLLTHQSEVTEELVVTASASLVSLEVWSTGSSHNSGTAAAGFANRSGVLELALLVMIILARQLKSRESGLSTI
jgi:hypothetical protein